MDVIQFYRGYFPDMQFERRWMFRALKERYKITQVLYPGCAVHITPSFYFKHVIYVDNYSTVKPFFADGYQVMQLINREKTYADKAYYNFIFADYNQPLPLPNAEYDLLISQHAGFVSQSCKRYLKIGGMLLVNNTHGDAGMASLDEDYILEAVVYQKNNRYFITDKNLSAYFVPKGNVKPTKASIQAAGKGIGYKKTAASYIFRRVQ